MRQRPSVSLSSFARRALLAFLVAATAFLAAGLQAANAVEPVKISQEDRALNLTATTEIYNNQTDKLTVTAADGPDGIRRRFAVEASSGNHQGDWAVFALANTSDEQIERLIVAPHYRLVNSKVFWPDLGSQRIVAITPSEGFALDRQPSAEDDVFRITLNPGAVVTFAAELASPDLPQLYLWEPDAYKDTVNSFTLYRGIVLGIAGLLAVFLTILFVVKGTSMLPATAALAWAVLGYICVDFGFLEKLITLTSSDQRIWRASTEVALAAGLVIFLFAYLNLNRWHVNLGYATFAWVLGLGLLFGVAIYDPSIAAGVARLSYAMTAAAGILLIIYLGFNRYDRAILLVPAWVLIIVWLFGAWLTVTGQIDNDIVQPALGGGLVLIVLLIGFTVMQHAFAGGALHQGLFSDLERQSLALTGSGDTVWDWDVARDRVVTIPDLSAKLGLTAGAMHGAVRNWLPRLHPDDRDRFKATLDVLLEHRRGRLSHEFRIRAEDGHFHWLAIRARPVLGSNGEIIRCVGTIIDVTEQRNSIDRLLNDALRDNLTGLPNRQIFIDRLEAMMALAPQDERLRPTVMIIDIDRYKLVNDALGIAAGDNILIALTRRLRRLLKPQDTLARLSGDQFGLLLVSETNPARIADFADAISRAISVPLSFANREVVLTASIGLATWMDQQATAGSLATDAELAMYRAKKAGGNRVEPFQPAFRTAGSDRMQMEADLRRALERKELSLAYQPIIRLSDAEIAGFEALLRWEHPKRGPVPVNELIDAAEATGLSAELNAFALERAAQDLNAWQEQTGAVPVFLTVSVLSGQLLNNELCTDVKSVLTRTQCRPEQLKLELGETMVMENPEQSRLVLERLKQSGIGLALADFGTGYSSLSYLAKFPFETIKIDKALVAGDGERRTILLRSLVSMARDLSMDVVAEGIESDEDAIELARLGCQYGQSYLFGQPMQPDSVLRLLRERFPLTRRA